ncbi:MAG: cupin domain-containing protein [Acidimicrobiales bacterium]
MTQFGSAGGPDVINLSAILRSFTDIYSPRIVGHVNDYDIRVAHARGDHVWHTHAETDEFFLVLDGTFEVSLRTDGRERTVILNKGDIFVVPKGTEHRPTSTGASILMFEPTGTLTTGDRPSEEVPAHVDSTTGHKI